MLPALLPVPPSRQTRRSCSSGAAVLRSERHAGFRDPSRAEAAALWRGSTCGEPVAEQLGTPLPTKAQPVRFTAAPSAAPSPPPCCDALLCCSVQLVRLMLQGQGGSERRACHDIGGCWAEVSARERPPQACAMQRGAARRPQQQQTGPQAPRGPTRLQWVYEKMAPPSAALLFSMRTPVSCTGCPPAWPPLLQYMPPPCTHPAGAGKQSL